MTPDKAEARRKVSYAPADRYQSFVGHTLVKNKFCERRSGSERKSHIRHIEFNLKRTLIEENRAIKSRHDQALQILVFPLNQQRASNASQRITQQHQEKAVVC